MAGLLAATAETRTANSHMHRDRSADRNTGERNPAGNTERVHEGHEIVRHRVDGECPADLLR